ncbi:MAG: hypothetical protein EOP62_17080 [Sphingomonadales bacterium]|nr:MAG: hypothetical protein EOP62_17080 [Sphingomonadales bacterium]
MPKDVTGPVAAPDAGLIFRTYDAASLTVMDRFQDSLALSAQELLQTHAALPREVHYVADLRRWLLSQATIAIHFQHRLDRRSPPISPGRLMQVLCDTKIASRNTIGTFLSEMNRYDFIAPISSHDRRRREFQATPKSEALIRHYFEIHLRSLDGIDGGRRHAIFRHYPELLPTAQSAFANRLCETREWHDPAHSIARFVRSDSGSSVLHDLVSSAPGEAVLSDTPIWIGEVSPVAFSRKYRISRMHVARLFGEARAAGLMGWAKSSNRGACWISPRLVHDYRHWQALKLAAVSHAFHDAAAMHAAGQAPQPQSV